jgi:hypothetical protein
VIRKLLPVQTAPYQRPQADTVEVPLAMAADDRGAIALRQMSLRQRRRRFTVSVTAFTLGAICILLQSPIRNEFLAPGPLTSHHAQILAGAGTDRCAACHESGNKSWTQWLSEAFQPGRRVAHCQSQLCMKCHADALNPRTAATPHNLTPDLLHAVRTKRGSSSAGLTNLLSLASADSVECSSCHREHHGLTDLTKMTDQQCQSCHARTFRSFETDHPEFTHWPQSARSGIAFDHVTHSNQHFPQQGLTFDCQSCHVDDAAGNVKLLVNYELACGQCHQRNIDLMRQSSFDLVRLPILDLEAVNTFDLDVGEWPTGARGDFDGNLPDLMRLLLMADDDAAAILKSRGSGFSFSDFEPDVQDDVQAAVTLTWSIKRLVHELATRGPATIRSRLQVALRRQISEQEIGGLTQGLSHSVFILATASWLPSLQTEMANDGRTDLADLLRNQKPFARIRDNGISPDDQEVLAVNPLSELLANQAPPLSPRTDGGEIQMPSMGQQISSLPKSELVLDSESENRLVDRRPDGKRPQRPLERSPDIGVQDLVKQHVAIPAAELLVENPLPQMMAGNSANLDGRQFAQQPTTQHVDSPSAEPTFSEPRAPELPLSQQFAERSAGKKAPARVGSDEILSDSFIQQLKQAKGEHSTNQDVGSAGDQLANLDWSDVESANRLNERIGPVRDEVLVGTPGNYGWFRNDRLFQIGYRPSGHGDRFVSTLIELIAATPLAETNPASAPYFQSLRGNSSLATCTLCHTLDAADSGTLVANWSPKYRNLLARQFTEFSHRSHLTQPELADCKSCHQLDCERSNAASFGHFDGGTAVSNFRPIGKANCVSCHRTGGTSQRCTLCHGYHIGSRKLARK